MGHIQEQITKAPKTNVVIMAEHISRVFNPGNLWISGIFVLSFHGIESAANAILLASILSIIGIGIPFIYLLHLKKKVDVVYSHEFTRRERLNPVIFYSLIVSVSICAGLVSIFAGHAIELLLFFIVSLQLIVWNYVLHYFLKCSGHTIAISSLTTIFIIVVGAFFLVLLPVILLVAWSRIKLGVHNRMEVTIGLLLGFIVTLITYSIGLRIWI